MSAAHSTPTQSRIKELLWYDKDTGKFTWLENRTNVKKGSIAGCRALNGYTLIRIDKKLCLAHRLAWVFMYGDFDLPNLIDHINGDKEDNRISNLRPATKVMNGQNRRSAQSNNRSSGLLGVAYIDHTRKFTAYIDKGGKRTYLGLFKRKEDAHQAYLEAKRSMHEGCTI